MPESKIIDVTFVYEATVRFPRKRNNADIDVRETVPFQLAVLDPNDAPVALRAEAPGEHRLPGERMRVDVRWSGGRFWVPVAHHTSSGQQERLLTLQEAEELVATGAWSSGFSLPVGIDWKLRQAKPLGEYEYADLIASGRDKAVRDIQAALSELCVIDGIVHKQQPEPLYRVSQNMSSGPFCKVVWRGDDRRSGVDLYRVDEYEEVCERLGRYDENVEERFWSGVVEIVMPETLHADPTPDAVRTEIARLLESGSREVAGMPIAHMVLYGELRDALAAGDVAAAARIAPEYMDAVNEDRWWRHRIDHVLERWRRRHQPEEAAPTADLPVLGFGAR